MNEYYMKVYMKSLFSKIENSTQKKIVIMLSCFYCFIVLVSCIFSFFNLIPKKIVGLRLIGIICICKLTLHIIIDNKLWDLLITFSANLTQNCYFDIFKM